MKSMRSMHYYIKLSAVCACLGLTAIFGQAQEVVERNLSPLHWRYDVRVKRSANGKSLRLSLHVDAMTRLESQDALVIYPSLVSASGDDRIDFAPVGIAGRIRYKAIMRSKALGENSRTSRFDNELHPFSDIEEQGGFLSGIRLVRTLDGGCPCDGERGTARLCGLWHT